MTGDQGKRTPSGVGDETEIAMESETGIPSAVPPQIRAQTYIDPYPTKGNRDKLNVTARLPKARTKTEAHSEGAYVPKHSLKLGKTASIAQCIKAITEQELLSRPGVTIKQILAEMLVEGALAGDRWAHEQVMDRTEGKPVQGLAIGAAGENPFLGLTDEQLRNIREMAAMRAKRLLGREEVAKEVLGRLEGSQDVSNRDLAGPSVTQEGL